MLVVLRVRDLGTRGASRVPCPVLSSWGAGVLQPPSTPQSCSGCWATGFSRGGRTQGRAFTERRVVPAAWTAHLWSWGAGAPLSSLRLGPEVGQGGWVAAQLCLLPQSCKSYRCTSACGLHESKWSVKRIFDSRVTHVNSVKVEFQSPPESFTGTRPRPFTGLLSVMLRGYRGPPLGSTYSPAFPTGSAPALALGRAVSVGEGAGGGFTPGRGRPW